MRPPPRQAAPPASSAAAASAAQGARPATIGGTCGSHASAPGRMASVMPSAARAIPAGASASQSRSPSGYATPPQCSSAAWTCWAHRAPGRALRSAPRRTRLSRDRAPGPSSRMRSSTAIQNSRPSGAVPAIGSSTACASIASATGRDSSPTASSSGQTAWITAPGPDVITPCSASSHQDGPSGALNPLRGAAIISCTCTTRNAWASHRRMARSSQGPSAAPSADAATAAVRAASRRSFMRPPLPAASVSAGPATPKLSGRRSQRQCRPLMETMPATSPPRLPRVMPIPGCAAPAYTAPPSHDAAPLPSRRPGWCALPASSLARPGSGACPHG